MGLFGFGKRPDLLVVDDDPAAVALMTEVLEEMGYSVISADNGRDAIEAAVSKRPSLIFLDVRMPELGGRDALDHLKRNPKTKDIPIVMVTGEQKGSEVERLFALGANDYVIKPVRLDKLREKARKFLPKPG